MMRSNQKALALIMVSICFFAAHSFASSELNYALISEGYGGRSNAQPWPCCDNCGAICAISDPPQCTCNDLAWTCHPECKNCVQSPLDVYPPLYQCMDRIANYCERKCHPESPDS